MERHSSRLRVSSSEEEEGKEVVEEEEEEEGEEEGEEEEEDEDEEVWTGGSSGLDSQWAYRSELSSLSAFTEEIQIQDR